MKLDRPFRDSERLAAMELRFEPGARCAHCGEFRIPCLVSGTGVVTCYECLCIAQGRPREERHHIAGRNNLPDTITVRANDHRYLSYLQYGWPPEVIRNPGKNIILTATGSLLGVADVLTLNTSEYNESLSGVLRKAAELLLCTEKSR